VAEPAVAHLLEDLLHVLHVPDALLHPIAFAVALTLVVFLHMVLGEMVPKNLTLVGPEQAVLWLGPPMLWFCTATRPLLVFMRWAARQVLRIWRIEATEAVKTVYTAEELAGLVAQSRTEGLLEPDEEARITGALALHERTAAEAMRPWASVTTVTEDVSPAALEALATRTGLSRFPVVVRESRRVVGFVHIKDVLGITGAARHQAISARFIRPLPVVPPDRRLAEALLAMRRDRRHMVLVSEGRTSLGVLTLHDVLRAVVGGQRNLRSVAS
jgi:CBS domain containing-hemolysin-like protein